MCIRDSNEYSKLKGYINVLSNKNIRVSLFIDPTREAVKVAHELGAPVIELHTGAYCHATGAARAQELARVQDAAAYAASLGLECHAGHGLSYDTVGDIAAIPTLAELNIGHFLVGEAIFVGFSEAIARMRARMDAARC
jgi:pyridoxine 5-phosphate synthase